MKPVLACALVAAAVSASAGAQATPPRRTVSEEMVIGRDPPTKDYIFALIGGIAVAGDGRVYVLDGLDCVIRVFDASGMYLRTFGGKGGGPAEFTQPSHLAIAGSNVTVRDPRAPKLVTFTLDGKHVSSKTVSVDEWYRERYPLRGRQTLVVNEKHHRRIAITPALLPKEPALQTVTLERQSSRRIDTVARIVLDERFIDRGDMYMTPVIDAFGNSGAWALSGDSVFAVVDGINGAVRWFDVTNDGMRETRTMSLGLTPAPVTPEQITAMLQRNSQSATRISSRGGVTTRGGHPPPGKLLNPPAHWSLATRAFFAADGALWVGNPRRVVSRNPDGKRTVTGPANVWTVFPPNDAAFAVEFPLAYDPVATRDGRVYGHGYNDDDGYVVTVYRINPR